MELAEKYASRLAEIKENVRISYEYFRNNNDRYHDFIKFVFKSSLSDADKRKLGVLQKPTIEFNVLEAIISRLRGEFAKQHPDITVRAADGLRVEDYTPELLNLIDVIQSHLREIFFHGTNDSLDYNLYSDLLGGGFSVAEVYTDYINERSFEQCIKVERVFDPTMTGFDPLARTSHKGDGQYCFQLYPKSREEFEKEYGNALTKDMKFERKAKKVQVAPNTITKPGEANNILCEFSWSYANTDQQIVLMADYYEKSKKKEKIVKLSNGHIVTRKQYERFLEEWDIAGVIEQAPIILEERVSYHETIHKYRFCGAGVLDHVETNYSHLPLVFFDGNSVIIRDSEDGASTQMTRPFPYHAKGIQQLKNFAGQTVAAEIENMVQHKFKVSIEAIPEEYKDAYTNIQQASTLVYNAFYKDNPEVPLMPPMEIQRTPTPPIVESTFMGTDRMTQMILGSYDSLLATNAQQTSGVAIQQGAMQSNAAAIPYLEGYIKGLNRVAQIIIDLIPKYYRTPRSLPIRGIDGKRSYQIINNPKDPNSIAMDYDPNSLQVKVEAGVNTAVQKQVALDQIIRMMQSSELFANFINTQGLEVLIDNMDIRGVEGLKEKAAEFMQQMQQQQEQAAKQAAEQGDPMAQATQAQVEAAKEIEFAKIEQKERQTESEHALEAARVAIEKQKADMSFLEVMAKIENADKKSLMEQQRIDAENAQDAARIAVDMAKHIGGMGG